MEVLPIVQPMHPSAASGVTAKLKVTQIYYIRINNHIIAFRNNFLTSKENCNFEHYKKCSVLPN